MECPLSRPYRLKVVRVDATFNFADYVKRVPDETFQQERLELLNGLYPKGKPRAGDSLKVIE